MRADIPCTLGYELDRAKQMLQGFQINIEETSTVFDDKKLERTQNPLVVVRQLNMEEQIRLTVSRFK